MITESLVLSGYCDLVHVSDILTKILIIGILFLLGMHNIYHKEEYIGLFFLKINRGRIR